MQGHHIMRRWQLSDWMPWACCKGTALASVFCWPNQRAVRCAMTSHAVAPPLETAQVLDSFPLLAPSATSAAQVKVLSWPVVFLAVRHRRSPIEPTYILCQCKERRVKRLEWHWYITDGLCCTTAIGYASLKPICWYTSPARRRSEGCHRGSGSFPRPRQSVRSLGPSPSHVSRPPSCARGIASSCPPSGSNRQQLENRESGRMSATSARSMAGAKDDSRTPEEHASHYMQELLPHEPYWRVAQYADTIDNAWSDSERFRMPISELPCRFHHSGMSAPTSM